MKRALLIFIFFFSTASFAQQEAIYSQYMFNQMVINPAYAGSRNSMSAVLLHRTRWLGMEGAPTTSTFSIHTDLDKSNLAIGANIAADNLGATTNLMAAIAGAYHLRLKRGRLALGLRAGFYNSSLNASKLSFSDPTDVLSTGARQSAAVPTADFGLYYYTRKFYVSLAFNHANNAKFNYADWGNDVTFNLRPYNVLGMGYAWEISENLMLKPSFLLKGTQGFNGNLDINLSALFYKMVWFGVSFRNQINMNLLLEVNVTDYMRVGYAYDNYLNKLGLATSGAHELFIGFDFSTGKTKTISTRYL